MIRQAAGNLHITDHRSNTLFNFLSFQINQFHDFIQLFTYTLICLEILSDGVQAHKNDRTFAGDIFETFLFVRPCASVFDHMRPCASVSDHV